MFFRRSTPLACALGASLAFTMLGCGSGESSTSSAAPIASGAAAPSASGAFVPSLSAGEQAPAFDLMGSDGKKHSLAEHKDKQVVVLAWFPKAFTGG